LLHLDVRRILISRSWSSFFMNCVSVGRKQGFSNDPTSCLKETVSGSPSTIFAGRELQRERETTKLGWASETTEPVLKISNWLLIKKNDLIKNPNHLGLSHLDGSNQVVAKNKGLGLFIITSGAWNKGSNNIKICSLISFFILQTYSLH